MNDKISAELVLADLQVIFRSVFEDEALEVERTTTARDVEGWDSLQHVTLMLEIEAHYGFRFSSAEVAGLKDVGELVDIVVRRRTGV